jgi:hypothetical protein
VRIKVAGFRTYAVGAEYMLRGGLVKLPCPTMTASADARRRPIMKRSDSSKPLISPPPDLPAIS